MWYERFLNRTDAYAKQAWDGSEYFSCYEPVTPKLFDDHLSGAITLGLPAVNGDGESRWGLFDVDIDGDHLDRIAAVLTQYGWHWLREAQRPGRQGHLWIFFAEPVCAADLRLFGRLIAERAGVAWSSIEFFPKSDRASWNEKKGRFSVCSVARLPLGIHRKPSANGIRGWFAGAPESVVEQMLWLMGQPLNPVAPIVEMAPQLRLLAAAKKRPAYKHDGAPVDEQEVRAALAHVPNTKDTHYDFWIQIGMAIKSADLPIDVWIDWSRRSPKFDLEYCESSWERLRPDGRIGLGTIYHHAAPNGYSRHDGRLNAIGHNASC